MSGLIAKTVTLTKYASGMMTPLGAVYLFGGAATLYMTVKKVKAHFGLEEEEPLEEVDLLPYHHPEEGRWRLKLTEKEP